MSSDRELEIERLARENEALKERVSELEQMLQTGQGHSPPPSPGEGELAQYESVLANVLEALPIGVWITDARGVIRVCNQAAKRIWAGARYVGVEQYGEYKGWMASSGKPIAPDEWAAARALTRGEITVEEEIEIECFDGTRKTILNSAIPMFDAEHGVVGIVIVNQDITQRKRTALAQARREAELKEAQRIGAVGSWVVDAENRFTWSDEMYRIYGVDPDQFDPNPTSFVRLVHPDDVQKIQEWIADFTSGKGPGDLEFRIPQPDGTIRVVNGRGVLTSDAAGKPIHMAGTLQDITERKKAEAERERLMAAVEQAGEIVCITSPDGRIEYVNAAFETLTGYSRAEALGQNPRMLRSGKTRESIYRELWTTIKDARPWRGRIENQRKDGAFFTLDTTITPILDGTGRIVNFVAVMRDVTEELRLTEQLVASQKLEAVGGLAGGIAHDFNNLLAVILGCARLAMTTRSESDAVYEDLAEIVAAGERAAVLTRQLLAFSRKQVLEPQVVDLNEVVIGLVSMLRRLIGEDVQLESLLAPDLGQVRADPGQLEQVIMNLAVNARDAMPHGGRLTIETANVVLDEAFAARHVAVRAGPHVLLAISDNGRGMDEATQRRMFEPFFTTKPLGQGTGLGLATVYGIVKQSGGTVWVYSELGKGTTIRLYLPRLLGDHSKELPSRPASQLAAGTETILLVEDEEAVRKTTTRILQMAGYRVLAAAHGNEALSLIEEHSGAIDLLLTDVVMPQMSGVQLARQLQELKPQLRIIYMSGYTDGAIISHGAPEKGTHFIAKPFSAVDLTQKLRQALDGEDTVVR